MNSPLRLTVVSTLAALALLSASCSSQDDGAGVRDLGAIDGQGGTDANSDSGSASAPAPDAGTNESGVGDGGYEYASNVDSHRLVVADLCGIGDLLDAGDFAAVEAIYRDGVNSVEADGSVRSIGEFAASSDRSHGLEAYYGTPTPLDDFVTAALTGTGDFAGETDAVRAQGVEKGMQNQTMVAWTIDELNSALAKAEAGDFDVADGAVHSWDEAWAFFHGSRPECAPFATGNSRAANFATVGGDGVTGLANEAILAAMVAGRDALLAEDLAGAKAAAHEVVRNIVITYSQAAVRYASLIEGDLAAGDEGSAKVHQTEGLAFWRVIEATVAAEGADTDAVNAVFDLGAEPGANGFGPEVTAALEPAWQALGIDSADIGELQ